MVELGIVGAKNSGKTTLIEKLIRHLVDGGRRVATVKHTSHDHRFDTEGKDSHRHREAGAGLTIAVSGKEVAVFASPDILESTQIQKLIEQHIDIWLIEGDAFSDRPKLLVTRRLVDLKRPYPNNIVATIGPERFDSVAVHFESSDISALGSFVTETILGCSKEEQL